MKTHSLNFLIIIKSPITAIMATLFALFSIEYLPSFMLLIWLLAAMLGDFVTGLLKSWATKQITTSEGFRKSVTKVLSYFGAILVITTLVNVIGLIDKSNTYDLTFVINGLMGFIVFTELYSICENILAAYPDSPLTKFVINPIMKFLRGKFEQNPLNEKDIDSITRG